VQDGYLIHVDNLQTHFFSREGTLRAVDGVSFQIRRGEVLGVAGESGCGKSVTSQSILRLIPANGKIVGGSILFDYRGKTIDLAQLDPKGQQMRQIRGREVSMIFQEPMTSFSPVHTIGRQIGEVMIYHQRLRPAEAREKTVEILRRVGLPRPEDAVHAYPFNLSGGMRQRAMIAMALSLEPSLLIADEPTTAVDVTIQAQVLELMRELQADFDMALMIITHDLAVIAELADRVLIMYLGKNVEYAPVDAVFDQEPKHPYTKALLRSVPVLGRGAAQELNPIQGAVPSLYEVPTGCAFHPRCPYFMKGLCEAQDPVAYQVEADHWARCFLYKDED
jgi:peptide/nickel transport system ATP-binding protein